MGTTSDIPSMPEHDNALTLNGDGLPHRPNHNIDDIVPEPQESKPRKRIIVCCDGANNESWIY
jgi:hypothetical protein